MSTKGYQIIHPLLKEKVNRIEKKAEELNCTIRRTIIQQQKMRELLLILQEIPGVFDRKEKVSDIKIIYMEEFKLKYEFNLVGFAYVNERLEHMLFAIDKRRRLWDTYLETLHILCNTADKIVSCLKMSNETEELLRCGKSIFLQGKELLERDSCVLMEEKDYNLEWWQEEKLEFQLETAKKRQETQRNLLSTV